MLKQSNFLRNMQSIVLMLLTTLMFSCDSSESDDLNSLEKNIVGTWVIEKSKENYYFLSDGNGYTEKVNSYDGVFRRAFAWSADDEQMVMTYQEDDYFADAQITYRVSVGEDNTLTLTNVENDKKTVYKRVNQNGTANVDFKNPPFVNYIRIYGYYYEVSMAEMSCKHAVGTNANYKYLMVYGNNGSMSPTGAYFMYATPYYEGINKEWGDGTYNIKSESGYWIYGGVYIYKGDTSSRCNGKLTIKTAGNIKVIDFNLDDGDVIGHIAGNWFY